MAWLILLVIALILFSLCQFRNYFRLVHLAIKLPGLSSHPFNPLGNMFLLHKTYKTYITTYGSHRYVKCWITLVPAILLMDPQDIKMIISNDKITRKSPVYCNLLKSVIGEGLITNNGHQWKKNRKLIQTIFNMNVLGTFTNIFLETSEDIVRLLNDKEDVNIVSYLNQYAIRNAWHSILGAPLSCDEMELQKKKNMLLGHHKINNWTTIKALCNPPSLDKAAKLSKTDLQNFIKKLIKDNTKSQTKSVKYKPLVDWFSELSVENDEFTEDDVVNEASTFIHASYDSVRSTLAYLLYCLAKHKDAQEKVIQEMDEICGHTGNEITINELNEMKYLEQCMKESMRLYPTVPLFLRQITQDITLGDHVFPEGTNIVISPLILHRLPNLFPEPLKFDPERFSKENKSKIDPYSFLPFSRGPRNCIGYKYAILEMKAFIASLLRKYRIFLAPGHGDLKFDYNITLITRGGIWLRFEERNSNF